MEVGIKTDTFPPDKRRSHPKFGDGGKNVEPNNLTLEKEQAELVMVEDRLKKDNLTLEKGQAELVMVEDRLKMNNLTLEKGHAELMMVVDRLKKEKRRRQNW